MRTRMHASPKIGALTAGLSYKCQSYTNRKKWHLFAIVCRAVKSSYHLVKITILYVKVHFYKDSGISVNKCALCCACVKTTATTCHPNSRLWCQLEQLNYQPATLSHRAVCLSASCCQSTSWTVDWAIVHRLDHLSLLWVINFLSR